MPARGGAAAAGAMKAQGRLPGSGSNEGAALLPNDGAGLPPRAVQQQWLTPQASFSYEEAEPEVGVDTNVRWINREHYEDKVSGFCKYDPMEWMVTLKFVIGEFMIWPWLILCLRVPHTDPGPGPGV